MKKSIFHLLIISLSAGLLAGCYANSQARGALIIPAERQSQITIIRRYPPPPHAPAHGYRYYAYDHELRYDAGFGAYVVIGSPGLYFYDDHYIRFYGGRWQARNRLQDVWHTAREKEIPHKLKERHWQHHREHEHRADYREEHHDKYREKRDRKRHEDDHHAREHHQDHHDKGRRYYRDHELIYDTGLGVYRVAKHPGIYFFNDRYFRQHRGKWQSSKQLNGTWRWAKKRNIPERLRKMKHNKSREHREKEYEDQQETRSRPKLQGIWQPR